MSTVSKMSVFIIIILTVYTLPSSLRSKRRFPLCPLSISTFNRYWIVKIRYDTCVYEDRKSFFFFFFSVYILLFNSPILSYNRKISVVIPVKDGEQVKATENT